MQSLDLLKYMKNRLYITKFDSIKIEYERWCSHDTHHDQFAGFKSMRVNTDLKHLDLRWYVTS